MAKRGQENCIGALKAAKRCFDYAQHDIDFVLFMECGRTRRTRTASERNDHASNVLRYTPG
jgi:hypothetical protein